MRVHTLQAQAVYNIARQMVIMREELPSNLINSAEKWNVTGRSVAGALYDSANKAKSNGEPLENFLQVVEKYDLDTLYTMSNHATLVFMEAEERGETISAEPDQILALFDSWAERNGWLKKK